MRLSWLFITLICASSFAAEKKDVIINPFVRSPSLSSSIQFNPSNSLNLSPATRVSFGNWLILDYQKRTIEVIEKDLPTPKAAQAFIDAVRDAFIDSNAMIDVDRQRKQLKDLSVRLLTEQDQSIPPVVEDAVAKALALRPYPMNFPSDKKIMQKALEALNANNPEAAKKILLKAMKVYP